MGAGGSLAFKRALCQTGRMDGVEAPRAISATAVMTWSGNLFDQLKQLNQTANSIIFGCQTNFQAIQSHESVR